MASSEKHTQTYTQKNWLLTLGCKSVHLLITQNAYTLPIEDAMWDTLYQERVWLQRVVAERLSVRQMIVGPILAYA